MSQENVDLVRGMYDAFAAGDVPTLLQSFDPEIVWNEAENFPYADGNPYVGPQAVVDGVFVRLGGEWTTGTWRSRRFSTPGIGPSRSVDTTPRTRRPAR